MHRTACRPLVLALAVLVSSSLAAQEDNVPPEGFRALFDGKSLGGWRSYIDGGNPTKSLARSPKERAAEYEQAAAELARFWRAEGGEIVNPDGKGPYLETVDGFGDFELRIDWKIAAGADSGIYLRGTPQVQIWDPVGGIPAAKVGSGGLYNNQKGPSVPLVRADKPAGEWNRFRMLLVDDVVTIWLNGELVVNETVLENYWDRAQRLLPVGPIQLQTHGGELRFRNVFIREIARMPNESGVLDRAGRPVGPGWKALFAGDDLAGIRHEPEFWRLQEGVLGGHASGSPAHHYAYTEAEFGDFELHAQVKLSGRNANSGVCIRTAPASFDDVPGYQVDMGDGFWGALWEERRDGMVDAFPPAEAAKIVRDGDWNHYYVIARGAHIRAWLNGVPTVDVWHPRGFPRGAIGFQLCHGEDRETTAAFRDVWIREIGPEFCLEHSPPRDDAGFAALFNGKDLDGWIGSVDGYQAEDGKLVCKKRGGGNLYLAQQYADFVLRFEFKLEPGANNGVGVRAEYNKDAAYHGMELQILENTHSSYTSLHDYQYHGSIYDLVPALRGYQKAPGQWNYQEVTADGHRIVVRLNGVTIVDADIEKDTPKEKWARHPGLFHKSGHIGFLGHGHRIEFRNLRLRELD